MDEVDEDDEEGNDCECDDMEEGDDDPVDVNVEDEARWEYAAGTSPLRTDCRVVAWLEKSIGGACFPRGPWCSGVGVLDGVLASNG